MEAGDSFFDEQLSDYSDDFEDDDSAAKINQPPPPLEFKSTSTPRRAKQDSSFTEKANRTDPVFRKAKSQYMSGRLGSKMSRSLIKGKGRAASEMNAASRKVKQGGMFSPRDRELSAKRNTIKRLENSLTETKRDLDDLKKENRLLNRLQIRQEKEINRFQTQEGELPEILARHSEEVRALKEQLKRSQEASQSYRQKANDLHQELLRVNTRKKKLEEVAKRRHLFEREKLTLQLQDANEQLQSKEKRISELERGIEAMNKNHNQEVRSLMLKNRALSTENEDLRHTSQKLHTQLKEKEREMDVLNIYTQRLGKNMPPRLATRMQAPITDTTGSQTELSCPPAKNVSLQTKLRLRTSSSQTEIPHPKAPVPGVAATTQTDIVASPKNDNLKVSNTHQTAGVGGHSTDPARQPTETKADVHVERVGNGPTYGLKSRTQSPPKASTSVMSGGGGAIDASLEEERKKRELIATLKAMDAQKDPPASQPIATASVMKSTAQPTSNAVVGGGERPPLAGKMTTQSTLSQPPKATENDEEEAKKKKLLLAKLMAIDEGGDPNSVTMSKMDVSKRRTSPKHSATAHKSTTSIQSWPETIENMYHGKPAFATEEDPFGSRHPSSSKSRASLKSKDFFLTEGGGDSPVTKRQGRRHQLEQKNSSEFNSDFSTGRNNKIGIKSMATVERKDNNPPPSTEATSAQLGYQPTFGRRVQTIGTKPKNGMIFGDFDSAIQPTVKKTEPPASLQLSNGSKLDSSGKDYPWENRINVSSKQEGVAGREREMEQENWKKSDGGPLSSPSMVFGYVGQQKPLLQNNSRASLLPLREKAATGSSLIPGYVDVTEPDDLEELAL